MTVREAFDPAGGFPLLGQFDIQFKRSSEHILGPWVNPSADYLGWGPCENWKHDTIVITKTPLGPATRAEVLANALWSGKATRFTPGGKGKGWRLEGPSILAWMGDDDSPSKGPCINFDGQTAYPSTLGVYLLATIGGTASENGGLTHSTSGLSANALNCDISEADSLRDRINKLLPLTDTPSEYRIDPDGELVFSARGDGGAYRVDPVVFFGPDVPNSREGAKVGYGAAVSASYDYGTEANILLFYDSSGTHIANGVMSGTEREIHTFKGTDAANDYIRKALVNDLASDMSSAARNDILKYQYDRRSTIKLSVPSGRVKQDVVCGDWVFVDAPECWIANYSAGQLFGGKERYPMALRTTTMEWPITQDMGVYVIHNATAYLGTDATQDLRPFIEFEAGPTTIGLTRGKPVTIRNVVKGTGQLNTWDQSR